MPIFKTSPQPVLEKFPFRYPVLEFPCIRRMFNKIIVKGFPKITLKPGYMDPFSNFRFHIAAFSDRSILDCVFKYLQFHEGKKLTILLRFQML